LNDLDEFEYGDAKEVGGSDLVIHAIHGDEAVLGSVPVRMASFLPQSDLTRDVPAWVLPE